MTKRLPLMLCLLAVHLFLTTALFSQSSLIREETWSLHTYPFSEKLSNICPRFGVVRPLRVAVLPHKVAGLRI